ncbi:MAG: hypothetical protein J5530_06285 [Clostridia bacterium]|nr:hypothetical protein [Clostridia bacterium]
MAANNSSAIYIDTRDKAVHYYGSVGGRAVHDVANYNSRTLDSAFFNDFTEILVGFMRKYTPAQAANSTVILPDSVIMTDIITLPAMKSNIMRGTVESTLSGLYKNRKELRLNTFYALQNRQYSEVCICGVKELLISAVKNSCVTSRFNAQNITFAAETSARAASALNSKLKGATYLLLDIKETYTRVVYVYKGMSLGFSALPFGYSILEKPKLASEDMLFDHSVAELAVLNARERAKARAVTFIGEGIVDATQVVIPQNDENDENGEEDDDAFSGGDFADPARQPGTVYKTLPKKSARKLPKYMLRPMPSADEGVADENFRIFAKWALCYLQGNPKLESLAGAKAVYVNLPEHLNHVITAINEEHSENKYQFLPASFDTRDEFVQRNIELYGGLFVGGSRNNNVF